VTKDALLVLGSISCKSHWQKMCERLFNLLTAAIAKYIAAPIKKMRGYLLNFLVVIWTLVKGFWAFRSQTLRKIVDGIEKEHFRSNIAVAPYTYAWVRRKIGSVERHPWLAISATIEIYFVCLYATKFMQPGWFGLKIPTHIEDYYRDFQNINMGLLTTQAALVAIVYPLVIAFVGLLFEARTTTGGRLNIFFKETESFVTGGSSLLLCAALAFQVVFTGQMPLRMSAAMTFLNCVWFIINVGGLSFFLLNAFYYIQPQTRSKLLWRYVVNIAWRVELHSLLMMRRLIHADYFGYIPNYLNDEGRAVSDRSGALTAKKPTVLMSIFASMYAEAININLGTERELYDVDFGILKVVAESWLRSQRQNSKARLAFKSALGGNEGNVPLAFIESSTLAWHQKFLIKISYRFKSKSRYAPPQTTEKLLKEIIADLILLVERGSVQEFDTHLQALTDLHVFLFQIAEAVPNANGDQVNYAVIEGNVSTLTVGDGWIRPYRDLFKRVLDRLRQEPEFFSRCVYIGPNLYYGASKSIPTSALKSINSIAFHLFWKLKEWAVATHKAETNEEEKLGTIFKLKPAPAAIYDGAWRSFVAGWERLLSCLYDRAAFKQENNWDYFTQIFDALWRHLHDTLIMVGATAMGGDLLGVSWSNDLLVRWYETWVGVAALNRDFLLRKSIITTDLLKKSWIEITAEPLSLIGERTFTPFDIFCCIIQNLWLDSQFVLACVFVEWIQKMGSSSIAPIAARKVLRHEVYDHAAVNFAQSPSSILDLLAIIIRIVSSGGRLDGSYASLLGGLSSELIDLTKDPLVSARMYSSWGVGDIYQLHRAQVLIMVATANDGAPSATLPQDFIKILRHHVESDYNVSFRLTYHFGKLLEAIDQFAPITDIPIVSAIKGADVQANFVALCSVTRAYISLIKDKLEELFNTRVQALPLDEARILAITHVAGKSAFNITTAEFPVPLFAEVTNVQAQLFPFTISTNNYERGGLTKPLMAQPSDDSIFDSTVHEYVGRIVLGDILHQGRMQTLTADTPDTWWTVVKRLVRRIERQGGKAILIVANVSSPRWLSEWRWNGAISGSARKPPDLEFKSDANKPSSYQFDINNIAVYRAPIEPTCCYLFPQSLLRKVEFTEYASGQLVLTEFENDPNNVRQGVLKVTFARRVTIGRHRITRINFGSVQSSLQAHSNRNSNE
jgi:hypothetical protein